MERFGKHDVPNDIFFFFPARQVVCYILGFVFLLPSK